MALNKGVQGTAHKVRCPLTPDVGHMNNRLPHVHWTFHIDNAKKSDHTVTLRTMGQSRTAENKMNSPTRRSTLRAASGATVNADVRQRRYEEELNRTHPLRAASGSHVVSHPAAFPVDRQRGLRRS